MKKFLNALLILSAFQTSVFATQGKCEPTSCQKMFFAAGSTLLGEEFRAISSNPGMIEESDNKNLLTQITRNYNNLVDDRTWTYNGLLPNVEGETMIARFDSGSHNGRKQAIANTVSIGASDSFPDFEDFGNVDNNGALSVFPIAIAGLSIVYNIKDTNGNRIKVNLNRKDLAEIFSGTKKNWSQFGTSHFPENNKPTDLPIKVVVRKDRSGTTEVFNQFLRNSPLPEEEEWDLSGDEGFTQEILQGANGTTTGELTLGTDFFQENGIKDVLNKVNSTSGAIGYVGHNNVLAYGLDSVFEAAIQNKAGGFEEPTSDTISSAAINAQKVDSEREIEVAEIFNSTRPDAYPICFAPYIIVRTCQLGNCHVKELRRFIYYLLTTGQSTAITLGFGRLPSNLICNGIEKLATLKSQECCVQQRVVQDCLNCSTGLREVELEA